MPSLRGHMVYLVELRQALERELPEVAAPVAAHWPCALLGCEAPDSHFFTEQTRPDLHMLDAQDPATWPGAVERWLNSQPQLSPGRAQPPETAAFVVGYLSHIGLDTWAEQYLHPDFPAAARRGLPDAWYPAAVADGVRRAPPSNAWPKPPSPPPTTSRGTPSSARRSPPGSAPSPSAPSPPASCPPSRSTTPGARAASSRSRVGRHPRTRLRRAAGGNPSAPRTPPPPTPSWRPCCPVPSSSPCTCSAAGGDGRLVRRHTSTNGNPKSRRGCAPPATLRWAWELRFGGAITRR